MPRAKRNLSRRDLMRLSTAAVGAAALGAGRVKRTRAAQAELKGTLRVWDQWDSPGSGGAMDQLVQTFQANHPGVQVKRDVYEGIQMTDVVPTALGANTGPDLLYYDLAPWALYQLYDAHELAPLDEAYDRFGWTDTVIELAQNWVTFNGARYALPHEFEFEPVFYNKRIYTELGLSVPTTHDEFLANCDACKEAGYIPIAAGNGGTGEMRHTFGFPLNNLLGKEAMDDIFFCGASWDRPEVVEAVRIVGVDYLKRGFYPESVNGIQPEDANNLFYIGQAAHRLTGSWFVGHMAEASMADEVDIFLYPSIDGSEVLPQSWFGSGYQLPVDSAEPDLAIEFLGFLFSPEAIKVWVEDAKVFPAMRFDTNGIEMDPLLAKSLGILWGGKQQLGWMIPSVVPTDFYNMLDAGFQQVLNGEKTPEQQVADLQAAWESAIKSGEYPLRCGEKGTSG